MIKQITLTAREVEMLEFMQNQEGQHKLTDVIHSCITNYYKIQYFNKQYMARKEKKPIIIEPQLTPEQACEQAGGNVMIKEGIPTCAIKISSSMMRYVPLSKPELFKK